MTDAWDGGGDLWNELSSLALARLVARSILKPIFGRTDALESCSRDREKRGARLTVDPSTDACQLKLECRALQQQSAADRLDSTNLPPCALL